MDQQTTVSLQYGPFTIESDLNLPELRRVRGSGRFPVSLRLGSVPQGLTDAVQQGPNRFFTQGEFLLEIPGTGRFYVHAGHEIRVEPVADAPISDLSIYLLGSVFGALCHQNGLLPLHASAVRTGGQVTAFLGDSGAGKSTMVALLRERGYEVFADDICLLEPVGDELRAAPLAGWLKLWRGSFEQIGVEPATENRTFSTDDKYRLYLEPQSTELVQVKQFCFLVRAPVSETAARLEPMGTAEAIAAMVSMVYPNYVPEDPAEEHRLFRQCAQALAGGRAVRLVMPWGWNCVDATLDMVERELLRQG